MFKFEQYFKSDTEQPLFLDGIEKRDTPALDNLCNMENCDIRELPDLFANKLKFIFGHCEKHSSMIDDKLDPQIDFIYQCYKSTRNISPTLNLSGFSSSLDNFDIFISQYAQGVSRKALGNLMQRINRFIETTIHPSRTIATFPDRYRNRDKLSFYNLEGRWIQIPSKYNASEKDYIEESIVKEIISIQESGYKRPDLYHATGSASLDGIARHGAILSANKAVALGETVKTGEYNTYIGWDEQSASGGRSGLGSIYTSKDPYSGYGIARWFNEYNVVFGLSKEKIAKYLQKDKGETNIRFEDYAGEGITIGPDAPLELVDIIYADHIYLDELNKWKEKNAPHAYIISLEADQLLRSRGKQEFYSPAEEISDWHPLLEQEPIVIE